LGIGTLQVGAPKRKVLERRLWRGKGSPFTNQQLEPSVSRRGIEGSGLLINTVWQLITAFYLTTLNIPEDSVNQMTPISSSIFGI
jgi:hypothetical protein